MSILSYAIDPFACGGRDTGRLSDDMFARPKHVSTEYSIVHNAHQFEQHDAAEIANKASNQSARTIVIDLTAAGDATTSAFAHLIVLRRWLLERGRDLRIIGLRARAERVFKVNRLSNVLPTA